METNGNSGRVTVESTVIDSTALLRLQADIVTKYPRFRSKRSDDLHLTLFHFGRPLEILSQLRGINPALPAPQFWTTFEQLLERTEQVIDQQFELKAVAIARFGSPSSPVVGLELERPAWLMDRRQLMTRAWNDFATQLGTDRKQLKADRPFRPHLALGRMAPPWPTRWPNFDLKLRFGPTRLRNVEYSPSS